MAQEYHWVAMDDVDNLHWLCRREPVGDDVAWADDTFFWDGPAFDCPIGHKRPIKITSDPEGVHIRYTGPAIDCRPKPEPEVVFTETETPGLVFARCSATCRHGYYCRSGSTFIVFFDSRCWSGNESAARKYLTAALQKPQA